MTYIIGRGRTARETYPEAVRAAGGTILKIGFDNSVPTEAGPALYPPGPATPILRDGVAPLQVTLTGFTPGNVVLVAMSIILEDGAGEPFGYGANLIPVVDVGAGPLQIVVNNVLSTFSEQDFPMTWMGAVLPTGVTADPLVQVWIRSLGVDQVLIQPFGAWLVACEVDVRSVTTLPSAVLAAIPP